MQANTNTNTNATNILDKLVTELTELTRITDAEVLREQQYDRVLAFAWEVNAAAGFDLPHHDAAPGEFLPFDLHLAFHFAVKAARGFVDGVANGAKELEDWGRILEGAIKAAKA